MKIVDATNELNHPYAPHLRIRSVSLVAGEEWSPQLTWWTMIQIDNGTGYWLQGQFRRELEPGMVLLVIGDAPGRILASRLNGMALNFFTMVPERLTGLITQGEQDFFKRAAGRGELAYRILPPLQPVAMKMKELCDRPVRGGLLFRLSLLQLLVEAFGREMELTEPSHVGMDVKERLRAFLLEMPPAALLEIGFDELAQIAHCTPRHLSRVFYDVVGMSFRDKRAEIRLVRARELLATSQSKVVDVAFKSGYKSLSLFNRMFTRRFGISPGRWRQKNGGIKDFVDQRNTKVRLTINPGRFAGV
jgi:AraC-like DNA-binding protein